MHRRLAIVLALCVTLLAAGTAAGASKKPKTVKVPAEAEIEGVSPRELGTAQLFRAEGGVGAFKRPCRFGRTVLVHQVNGGVDAVVASVTTLYQPGTPGGEFEGFWEATWTTPPNAFSFYIEVPARKIKKKHILCKRGVSETLVLPG